MTTASRPRVLLCDDAPGFRLLVRTVLDDVGLEIAAEASNWQEAERLAALEPYAAVVLDLWLPTFDHAAVGRVRAACPGAVLAVISSLSVTEVEALVDDLDGIDLVLSKRESPDHLARTLAARVLGA